MTHTDRVTHKPMPKFWAGNLHVTATANQVLMREDMAKGFFRHQIGDWGDVCAEDREANETALSVGGRLFSVYHDRNGVTFWIVTEADRNSTTVLLPDDY